MDAHGKSKAATLLELNGRSDGSLPENELRHGEIAGASGQDRMDMHRMGRRQQLRRNFHNISIFGLATMVQVTWIAILVSMQFAYIDGGRAGAIWDWLAVSILMLFVTMSLAEMASMAPTSSGQYHWTSEFAPRSIQKPMSYISGWLSALAWQASIAAPAFQTAVITLILASLGNPDYNVKPWEETVVCLGVIALVVVINVFAARALPAIERSSVAFLYVGMFATLIPLWCLAPKVSASEAFTSFSNFGGWPTTGAACVVGQLTAVGTLTGVDAITHMAEEVRDASRTVPRMMVANMSFNLVIGLVTTITLSLIIQDVKTQVAESTAIYPFVVIFQSAVGSTGGAIGLTVLIVPLSLLCAVSAMAAASRQAWAFARDGGLPFSDVLTKIITVNGVPLPVNAMLASAAITVLIALLNLGGSEVFDSVFGLSAGAFCMTYAIGIGSVLWRRTLSRERLPPARWSLGRFGIPINIISLLFLIEAIGVAYFPLYKQVTAASMNWGVAVFGIVAVAALTYYVLRAHKSYQGPVVHVRVD